MDCPKCGAPETLCQTRFDEFLVLEFTDAGYGAVHHLTVTAYMLQHSSKLTREGWLHERELLREFLRDLVDSGKRTFKIKSRDGLPVINKSTWTKTILDVHTESVEVYCVDVAVWARSVLNDVEKIKI